MQPIPASSPEGGRSGTKDSARGTGSAARAAGRLLADFAARPSTSPSTGEWQVSARERRDGQADDGSYFFLGAGAKHSRKQPARPASQAEDLPSHRSALREQLVAARASASRLQAECEGLRERLAKSQAEGEAKDAEGEALRGLLAEVLAEAKERGQKAAASHSEELGQLQARLRDREGAAEREARRLRERLGEAQQERRLLQERLLQREQHAGSEASRFGALLGGLTVEADTLRKEGEALNGETAALRGRCARLQAEVDALRAERDALLGDNEALATRLDDSLRERDGEAHLSASALEEARRLSDARLAEAEVRACEAEASRRQAAESEIRAQQLEVERAAAAGLNEALRAEEAALRARLEEAAHDLERERQASSVSRSAHREAELLRERLAQETQRNFELRSRMEEEMRQLLEAKMVDAINQKVELHICVPCTALTYNSAPPLLASVADGLSSARIAAFLEREVFPHFEPLWARLDDKDCGPDGSDKRAYSGKMLERFTEAVRAYVEMAQAAQLQRAAQ